MMTLFSSHNAAEQTPVAVSMQRIIGGMCQSLLTLLFLLFGVEERLLVNNLYEG